MKDEEFKDKALSAMPKWAWATIAIMLAFSITLRIIGLDVSTPLNNIMTAKAKQIESQTACRPDDLLHRIESLEAVAHPPK